MKVNIEDIKQLRDQTSASLADVRNALEKAEGDFDKALKFLYEKGLSSATKRMDKEANQGVIFSYVHNSRIGVMLELNCETDFVARNPEFTDLAKDLAMQIILGDASFISAEDAEEGADKDSILMNQKFFKAEGVRVEDHIKQSIAKFGENIKIRRFYKMILGS